MIITIDGQIATGKSTIAKKLAEELGFIYFDTGAMYRCITYLAIKNKLNIENSSDYAKTNKVLDNSASSAAGAGAAGYDYAYADPGAR